MVGEEFDIKMGTNTMDSGMKVKFMVLDGLKKAKRKSLLKVFGNMVNFVVLSRQKIVMAIIFLEITNIFNHWSHDSVNHLIFLHFMNPIHFLINFC